MWEEPQLCAAASPFAPDLFGEESKKKSWRVFVTKATAGSSSFFSSFFFFACLPAFQFGTSPAVGVAEVAAQAYYVSSLRGSANDLGQRGGVALNLFQARPSVGQEQCSIARYQMKYSSGHQWIRLHVDLCTEEA